MPQRSRGWRSPRMPFSSGENTLDARRSLSFLHLFDRLLPSADDFRLCWRFLHGGFACNRGFRHYLGTLMCDADDHAVEVIEHLHALGQREVGDAEVVVNPQIADVDLDLVRNGVRKALNVEFADLE